MNEQTEIEQEDIEMVFVRVERALAEAPEVVAHVRSVILTGKTERGETLPEWSAPMRITAQDDIDELYVRLLNWVREFAVALHGRPSALARAALQTTEAHVGGGFTPGQTEYVGFRGGVTPEGAAALIRDLVVWLNVRAERIQDLDVARVYAQDVVETLRTLRGRYPTAPRPERLVYGRPCPAEGCGEFAVRVEWRSEEEDDLRAGCEACGHMLSVRQVLRHADRGRTRTFEVQVRTGETVRTVLVRAKSQWEAKAAAVEDPFVESAISVSEAPHE